MARKSKVFHRSTPKRKRPEILSIGVEASAHPGLAQVQTDLDRILRRFSVDHVEIEERGHTLELSVFTRAPVAASFSHLKDRIIRAIKPISDNRAVVVNIRPLSTCEPSHLQRTRLSHGVIIRASHPMNFNQTPALGVQSSKLQTKLKSKESQVRLEAVNALGRLKDESAAPSLCRLLKEDLDPEVRRAAAEALGNIFA